MFADKTLRCDCGYEVRAPDEDALVVAIRQHAAEAHGIDFSVELAREVAGGIEPEPGGALERETQ
jgi:predicted small metal-binding protein